MDVSAATQEFKGGIGVTQALQASFFPTRLFIVQMMGLEIDAL
jgi:hypothetical protein